MQVASLGRYRIERELGRGAMGRVFLAYDPQIERKVAIKTIQIFASLPEAERIQARDRFLREARSAGKLLHPGIVTIFDVGEADGVPYLAMEYVEGRTLDAFCVVAELLPVPIVVTLVASAAEALGFAHGNGIVHRDIKPTNLMRVAENTVKVMDFGLAKNPATSMTHDGSLLGTPNYMSPEQVRGEALDGRSDLFSLAVVLYEMLTGDKPFGGDSISSVLYRIVHEPPRHAALHLERVPPPLGTFLERALAKSPADRFPDGRAFALALRKAGDAVRVATLRPAAMAVRAEPRIAPPPPAPTAAQRRSLAPWIVGIALLVAAVAAGMTMLPDRFGLPRTSGMQASVRTEPPGIPVRMNGATLDDGIVRFARDGPFGVLTASQGCREAKHRIDPGDGGREIVLVVDPLKADVVVDPGIVGASVAVNGQDVGATPATVTLDLCRDNTIEARAAGYHSATVAVPAMATPLEARNATGGLKLEAIPMGRLVLPSTRLPATFVVDGKEVVRVDGGLELPAGVHEVRAINADRFLDVGVSVNVPAGGAASPEFRLPTMSRLIVQTFPPNCRVSLKRDGTGWRLAGETPLRYEVAPGRYDLKVESPRSGEVREQEVVVQPGINPPVRISFGRSAR